MLKERIVVIFTTNKIGSTGQIVAVMRKHELEN